MDVADSEISFAEVAASAERLKSEGLPVTVVALHGAHPGASLPSIHAHLSAWRSSQAQPLQEPKAAIPDAILAGLGDWAHQFSEEKVATLRAVQLQTERDVASLLQMIEEKSAELGELRDQLSSLTQEHEQAKANLDEREAHIGRLTVEVRHARDLASDALVGRAKNQLAIDGKDAQIADLRQQLERSMAASAAASDARLAAEMELVGATTARDGYAAEITDLRAQLDASRKGRHA